MIRIRGLSDKTCIKQSGDQKAIKRTVVGHFLLWRRSSSPLSITAASSAEAQSKVPTASKARPKSGATPHDDELGA